MPVESALKEIIAGGQVPPDLLITYDDTHGLWEGTAIIMHGSGRAERRERAQGAAAPQVFEASILPDQLLELVKLLIESQAWEQQTPNRQPVPYESRAGLTISVGGETSSIWEWFNEMGTNRRLIQIKKKMSEMTGVTQ